MFSKACEHAIRAALFISIKSRNGSRLGIAEIARQIDAPVPFTAKILQRLAREGLIASMKGPNGGFYIDAKARPVTLASIVKAVDGSDDALHVCILGLKACSDHFPCPIHNEVKSYKNQLRMVMCEATLQQLSADLAKGKTFLKNPRKRKIPG